MIIIRVFRRIHINLVFYLVNHIFCGTKYYEVKRKLLISLGHEIGRGTKVVGPVFCSGHMKIGANCWVGRNFEINGNGCVEINERCDIAPNVSFITGSHMIGEAFRRAGEGVNENIVIGKGCWICSRATILGNVTIGDGSVVGACSLVNKSIPSNVLVGGVPATTIKELT